MMKGNLNEGSVLSNIVYFSLPYLLSYFLQTLYGMADLFITGQFNQTAQITAVSVGSQVMHMITVMIVGLAMGTTVRIGQSIGARDKEQAAYTIGNTVTGFLIVSVVVAVVLVFMADPIVALISTPAEAIEGTRWYLTVCFAGIPFIVAYNVISSIFRGLGDSKSPMYFVAVACVINIVLDYVFIGVMGLGAVGAALGTTISQGCSVIISLIFVRNKDIGVKLKPLHLRLRKDIIEPVLKIGIPVSLQDGFIQIGFIIITIIANRRGLNDAAAVGIVEKIIGVMFLVPSSMLSAVSAIVAQNVGAGEEKRADETLKYAIMICAGFGFATAIAIQFVAEPLVGVFDATPAVMVSGGQYLRGYIWDCAFAGIHFCFSGYFCAKGKSGISFLHNLLSIVIARVPGAFIMSEMYADTLFPMGMATVCGSVLSTVICVVAYIVMKRKRRIS